jgi:hypothetical protein
MRRQQIGQRRRDGAIAERVDDGERQDRRRHRSDRAGVDDAKRRDHGRGVVAVGFYTLFAWMPTYLTHILRPPVAHADLINAAVTHPVRGKSTGNLAAPAWYIAAAALATTAVNFVATRPAPPLAPLR